MQHSDRRRGFFSARDRIPLGLVILCTLIEAVFQVSEAGWAGPPDLRVFVFALGAFWPAVIGDWAPIYPGQAAVMFVTYGFLHGGLLHLAVNMLTLWSLGRVVVGVQGARVFFAIYAASLLAGGAVYGVLAPSGPAMVGASGALFGLVGAVMVWTSRARARGLQVWVSLGRGVAGLVLLNGVLWWALDGRLAWQAHLGGFLAGAGLAAIWSLRRS